MQTTELYQWSQSVVSLKMCDYPDKCDMSLEEDISGVLGARSVIESNRSISVLWKGSHTVLIRNSLKDFKSIYSLNRGSN